MRLKVNTNSIWGTGVNAAISLGGVAVGLAIPLTQGTSSLSVTAAVIIGVFGLFTEYRPLK